MPSVKIQVPEYTVEQLLTLKQTQRSLKSKVPFILPQSLTLHFIKTSSISSRKSENKHCKVIQFLLLPKLEIS